MLYIHPGKANINDLLLLIANLAVTVLFNVALISAVA
jgi:hypothetical protein